MSISDNLSGMFAHTGASFAHRFLAVLLLLALVLAIPPFSWASQELVKNGGFETGDLANWTGDNSSVQSSSLGPQIAHSGKYSARIGTETIEGHLFQTVSIPALSIAKFTAWYRAEESSKLTILLKRSDGAVIQQWQATGVASWASVTYDLDLAYAGQSVTIEFVGIGHREIETENTFECDVNPTLTHIECHRVTEVVAVNDYWPYVDDVSFSSTVVAYQNTVSIDGLPHELTTRFLVDSGNETTIAGAESRTFLFKIGETHSISVDAYVYKDNRARYYCASNSTNVDSAGSSAFHYRLQYLLSVSSQHGTATGAGWYDEGSEAFAVLDTGTVSDGLFYNWAFTGWSNDATGKGLKSDPIVIDGPKEATAEWNHKFSVTFYAVIAAVIVVALAIAILAFMRTRRPVSAASTVVCPDCQHENPRRNRFCRSRFSFEFISIHYPANGDGTSLSMDVRS